MNPGEKSVLYVVATPIGNLGDLSPRAAEVLGNVDFIASEDTRVTRKLLASMDIHKELVSCYREVESRKADEIASRIASGESCAFCSDAGTPGVSDPGQKLADRCISLGIPVIPIPGCCAAAAAISASGMDCTRFCFEGFLPSSGKQRRERIAELKEEKRTIVLYEAPHRLRATLSDLLSELGDRRIFVAREMTKLHEEYMRTTLSAALASLEGSEPRGEYAIVMEGASAGEAEVPDLQNAAEAARKLRNSGMSLSAACRKASEETGVPRNELYRLLCREDS
ncbi:MAG: 16S rRNA (cytidine(1402)-2'-O)-methyltransferase [Oscillospiraceae bacterium]|jgi:16S rRNA (cytidine1402-2'-O)-methyltransferase